MFGRLRRKAGRHAADDRLESPSGDDGADDLGEGSTAEVDAEVDVDLDSEAGEDTDGTAAEPGGGPWDAGSAPEDDVPRLDLGGLRVPTPPDVEVRLEADAGGQVAAVVLVAGNCALQLGAFAAPRSEGIWDEVRDEILDGIVEEGGRGERVPGDLGDELRAAVRTPDGEQHLRFVGVDGPRWFLRAVFSGPAATDPAAAPVLVAALHDVVVVRGTEAMPVRDPLPLRLPREVLEQQQTAARPVAPTPPRRGPETTEVG